MTTTVIWFDARAWPLQANAAVPTVTLDEAINSLANAESSTYCDLCHGVMTARLYLDLSISPPRSSRASLTSVSTSLYTEAETEAEIVTTERVTPVKAKIVEC